MVRRSLACRCFKWWSFWQVFAAMQWKKVRTNLCLRGAWNVCLQTSWWSPEDLASWYFRKLSKSLSLINSCQVGKKLIVSILLFGSFALIPENLLLYERSSKCLWYCLMVKLPLKGDLMLMVNLWLKMQKLYFLREIHHHHHMICRLMMLILHVNYWTLSVLQENIIFRASKRDSWQRKSLLKIVNWLNWMKIFWS